jgi:hypothetical protein
LVKVMARGLRDARGVANVTLGLADIHHLPFADASFDLVTCRARGASLLAHRGGVAGDAARAAPWRTPGDRRSQRAGGDLYTCSCALSALSTTTVASMR